jgi:hypothetical protein
MSTVPPDQNQDQQGASPQWRSMSKVKRYYVPVAVSLIVVAATGYPTWEIGGQNRISSVEVARIRSEGTITGFIIIVVGKRTLPRDASVKIQNVALVDSESNPHFRIRLTLWDGRERELNQGYVEFPIDPQLQQNLPDRKTQIEAQLARTKRDGVVTVQVDYRDVSWLGGNDAIGIGGGTQTVPVSIVKE